MEIDPAHWGHLLGFCVTLLIYFGVDFHVTRKRAAASSRSAVVWAVVSAAGEIASAFALVLTWVAMFIPPEAEFLDVRLIFVVGSIAGGCAVILTVETVIQRVASAARLSRELARTANSETAGGVPSTTMGGPPPAVHGG